MITVNKNTHPEDEGIFNTIRSRLTRAGVNWLRFFSSWFGLSVLWTATNVCPCCGKPICGINIIFSGLVGLLGSLFLLVCRKWDVITHGIKSALNLSGRRTIIKD